MKRNGGLLLLAVLAAGGCVARDSRPAAAEAAPTALQKQVFVVRHLQKAQGDDPPLSAEGAANAQRLAELLAGKGIVAIFATQPPAASTANKSNPPLRFIAQP